MPQTGFSGSVSSPKVDVFIDTGNQFLNHTVDGFLKIGSVGVARAAAQETYNAVAKGNVDLEQSLTKMCKEGVFFGTTAGVYVGMDYGMEKIRGTRDWKNALLAGAATGALVSAVGNNKRDKIVQDAITGGAVATAAQFINYLT
ncbi:Outer envelope pore protein 16, chloroplastic [Heracleum sosnowskyi]|uniref:Outer envelope pore protein 16, chloroplastic n=1 Tax=Heracleum sosnowskyi TaxID=360622 RepID=A0AAD8M2Q8_9APIA|nr:Outer envelope pore protein 16, chloroplastic [Heracleum sosnowskyi]